MVFESLDAEADIFLRKGETVAGLKKRLQTVQDGRQGRLEVVRHL